MLLVNLRIRPFVHHNKNKKTSEEVLYYAYAWLGLVDGLRNYFSKQLSPKPGFVEFKTLVPIKAVTIERNTQTTIIGMAIKGLTLKWMRMFHMSNSSVKAKIGTAMKNNVLPPP